MTATTGGSGLLGRTAKVSGVGEATPDIRLRVGYIWPSITRRRNPHISFNCQELELKFNLNRMALSS